MTSTARSSGTASATAIAAPWPLGSGTLVKVIAEQDRQREQVDQRLGEHGARDDRQQPARAAVEPARQDQNARGLADAARQDRRAHHADHRRAHDGAPRQRRVRQRRAQRLVPGDRAHQQRQRHQREREHDPAGCGRHERMADALQFQARERERDQPREHDHDEHHAQPPQRRATPTDSWVLARIHLARGLSGQVARAKGRGVAPSPLRALAKSSSAARYADGRSDEARSITAACGR